MLQLFVIYEVTCRFTSGSLIGFGLKTRHLGPTGHPGNRPKHLGAEGQRGTEIRILNGITSGPIGDWAKQTWPRKEKE